MAGVLLHNINIDRVHIDIVLGPDTLYLGIQNLPYVFNQGVSMVADVFEVKPKIEGKEEYKLLS